MLCPRAKWYQFLILLCDLIRIILRMKTGLMFILHVNVKCTHTCKRLYFSRVSNSWSCRFRCCHSSFVPAIFFRNFVQSSRFLGYIFFCILMKLQALFSPHLVNLWGLLWNVGLPVCSLQLLYPYTVEYVLYCWTYYKVLLLHPIFVYTASCPENSKGKVHWYLALG